MCVCVCFYLCLCIFLSPLVCIWPAELSRVAFVLNPVFFPSLLFHSFFSSLSLPQDFADQLDTMPKITMVNNVIHNNEGYGVILVKPNDGVPEDQPAKAGAAGKHRPRPPAVHVHPSSLPQNPPSGSVFSSAVPVHVGSRLMKV